MNQTTNKNNFSGIWTALVTPFLADQSIDWQSFKKLLMIQEDAGVKGIVICGTTGESPTLSHDEKIKLTEVARETLSSSTRVMVGSGGNNTKDTVELSKDVVKAGADSLLVVTPPYNKPTPDGLKIHYGMISEAVNVPICLYHVPGRTAQTLSPDVIADLCTIPNVQVVKEASADMALFSRAVIRTGNNAVYLSGDDMTYLSSLVIGGIGCISVASNVFPKEMVEMTNAFFENKLELARSYHNALLGMMDSLFCETNPGPTKAALHFMGLIENVVRPPLAPVRAQSYECIKATFEKTKSLLASVR